MFKVLSVRTALSIQAHPNKKLAEKLHVSMPDKYADPNHKPEIAVALVDDFLACYGFASCEVIQANMKENPVLAEIFPLREGCDAPDAQYLKDSVNKMFYELDTPESKELLTSYIEKINENIKGKDQASLSEHQNLFLRLVSQYGNCDIGILFTFFFNILRLKKGESFVISPDEPHAYIAGDLIEAMVASDNVVRGGLTPKFKDTKNLCDMLIYEFKERKANSGKVITDEAGSKIIEYKTGYDEFMVTHLSMTGASGTEVSYKFNSLAMAIVMNGDAEGTLEGFDQIKVEDKTAYFIMPGQKFTLKKSSDNDVSIFFCSCDV